MPLFARSILCYNVSDMILVTGGTGFIGRALIKKLVSQKRPVRLLLNPSPKSPNLPKGVAIDVAVSSLKDERGLRAAMKDVDTVFHLAGSERRGIHADLEGTDIDGSQCISRVSADANISRFFFLSHLGADRASAFAVLKAKAIAEGYIVRSGVDYTIFQTAAVFGPGDQFTCPLASLLRLSPGIFLIPGKGDSILQPLYIDDLVACLCLALDDPTTINQTYQLGGGEYISFLQILHILLEKIKKRRFIISIAPPYLRMIGVFMEHALPRFPVSIHWLDYLATDRSCALDSLPRQFGVIPARFAHELDYLGKPDPRRNRRSR